MGQAPAGREARIPVFKAQLNFSFTWMTCNFKESLLINQQNGNNITKCHNISKVPAQITVARLEISKDSESKSD